jgi:hypothetical protein
VDAAQRAKLDGPVAHGIRFFLGLDAFLQQLPIMPSRSSAACWPIGVIDGGC